MIDRRAFIGSLAIGTFTVPRAGQLSLAQRRRIGILSPGVTSNMTGPPPQSPSIDALLRGLRERGKVYGRDFVTEPRGAEGKQDRLPRLAAELAGLQVDVIVASGVTLGAVKQATSTIPVVMVGSDDPVARGHVRSLAHPGGNFTGLSTQGVDGAASRRRYRSR